MTAVDSACNYWVDSAGEPGVWPAAEGRHDADVVIVGGGFTGLWTAYYLTTLRPELAVTVLEAETVGHGASGRNGGWAIGNLAGLERLIGDLDRTARRAICAQLADNVDEIGRVTAREAIEADFHKGGTLDAAARYPQQVAMQKAHRDALIELGHAPEDCVWLDGPALAERAAFRDGYGAVFFRHTASVHPMKLVRGLARVLAQRGVTISEHSRARYLAPHHVITTNGAQFNARHIVQATEGYSECLAGLGRRVLSVRSLVIATEPLSEAVWARVGLGDRPTFCDASRVINYGHRSRDGRLIFGARGAYPLGGTPKQDHAITPAEIEMRRRLLLDLFPGLPEDLVVTHGWGGSLGLSRRFRPHAIVDPHTGLATAGGYAGEGVAASHLMGRTTAELIVGEDTPRTRAPWAHADAAIDQVLARWEPEPLRWLAAQTISASYGAEESLLRRGCDGALTRSVMRANDGFAAIIE
ncbi:NAD(P)/FAD-dependent oxidoreductase [Salinisphaera hydrothermalis]|uniref:NAD(P)/FAD-dependent oxidoreductase n=1 Tax=Salinisphaera hydrothermalis TaxID=563188 RepID=UPI00333E8146